MGVPSSFQAWDPYPVYLREGQGSHVWDVDGNEYLDFHNGFGVAWSSATRTRRSSRRSSTRPRTGTHFAAPTEATVALRRGALPAVPSRHGALLQLRHRGDDERDPHRARRDRPRAHRQDRGLVPRAPRRGDVLGRARTPTSMGGRDAPATTPMSNGIPAVMAEYTHVVPFNDLDVLRALLDERGDEIACLILEPVMMNIGICQPEPGYLQGARGPAAPARRAAHLRRGQERRDDRRRRRGRALRRASPTSRAGPRRSAAALPAPRSAAGADVMDVDRPRRGAAGHVQRQPARRRGRARDAHRGAHARRLRAVSPSSAPASPRAAPRRMAEQLHPRPRGRPRRQGLRVVPARAAAQLPRLPRDQPGPLPRVVPVGDEPGRLHDARATRSSGRSRCSTPRPTSTATSTSSPTSARPSRRPDDARHGSRPTGSTSRSPSTARRTGARSSCCTGSRTRRYIWRAPGRRAHRGRATARSRRTSAATASRTRRKAVDAYAIPNLAMDAAGVLDALGHRAGRRRRPRLGRVGRVARRDDLARTGSSGCARVSVGHPAAFFTAGRLRAEAEELVHALLPSRGRSPRTGSHATGSRTSGRWPQDPVDFDRNVADMSQAGPAHRRAQLVPGHDQRRRVRGAAARAAAGRLPDDGRLEQRRLRARPRCR